MKVLLGTEWVTVDTLKEASTTCLDYIKQNQIERSDWTCGLVSENGKFIKAISYSGAIIKCSAARMENALIFSVPRTDLSL